MMLDLDIGSEDEIPCEGAAEGPDLVSPGSWFMALGEMESVGVVHEKTRGHTPSS